MTLFAMTGEERVECRKRVSITLLQCSSAWISLEKKTLFVCETFHNVMMKELVQFPVNNGVFQASPKVLCNRNTTIVLWVDGKKNHIKFTLWGFCWAYLNVFEECLKSQFIFLIFDTTGVYLECISFAEG